MIAAYEDSMHWTLKEAQLPDNVDPLDSKLESAEERARIARVFERGLTKPSVTCCRSNAGNRARARAGSAKCGNSAASDCS